MENKKVGQDGEKDGEQDGKRDGDGLRRWTCTMEIDFGGN